MHHFLLNKPNNQSFIRSHFSTVKKKNLVGQSQIFIFWIISIIKNHVLWGSVPNDFILGSINECFNETQRDIESHKGMFSK